MLRSRAFALAAIVTLALPGCAWLRRSSVSSAPENLPATTESRDPSVSGSGRYTAFSSNASNLVGGDTNVTSDVFVRDNTAETTERVSVATGGAQGVGSSSTPSISNDGRYVAFLSSASNLAPDGDAAIDVFVHDRTAGTTELVSVNDDESSIPNAAAVAVISGDGRSVAFSYRVARQFDGFPQPVLPHGPFIRHLDTQSTTHAGGSAASNFVTPTSFELNDAGTRVVFAQVNVVGLTSTVQVADANTGVDITTAGTNTVSPAWFTTTAVAISGDGSQFGYVLNPKVETDPASLNIATTTNPSQPILTAKEVPATSALFLSTDGGLIGARILRNGLHVAAITLPQLRSIWTVVSATTDGLHPADTTGVAMSADGKYFAFGSSDSVLVLDDTNGVADVFTRVAGNANTPPT